MARPGSVLAAEAGCTVVPFRRRAVDVAAAARWRARLDGVRSAVVWLALAAALVAAGSLVVLLLAYAFVVVVPAAIVAIAWLLARRRRPAPRRRLEAVAPRR